MIVSDIVYEMHHEKNCFILKQTTKGQITSTFLKSNQGLLFTVKIGYSTSSQFQYTKFLDSSLQCDCRSNMVGNPKDNFSYSETYMIPPGVLTVDL